MIRRTLPAIAYATGISGAVAGTLGLAAGSSDLTRAGILLALAALPPVFAHQCRRAQRNSEQQLADAHAAGYWLALDHVARGLLDQHTAPPDGGTPTDDATARQHPTSNVYHLRPCHPSDLTERKRAQ